MLHKFQSKRQMTARERGLADAYVLALKDVVDLATEIDARGKLSLALAEWAREEQLNAAAELRKHDLEKALVILRLVRGGLQAYRDSLKPEEPRPNDV